MTNSSDPIKEGMRLNRRAFLRNSMGLLGGAALSELGFASGLGETARIPGLAKAKRVIYLFQSGAPSQYETLDWKPKIAELRGQDLPESVRKGQRLTTMTSGQAKFPMVNSQFAFSQNKNCGTYISDMLPHTQDIADKICVINSMHTEAINHDPAVTFFQTGSQLAGRPSMGAWLSYGLGSMNLDLPTFMVMISRTVSAQPLYDRLWGPGYLPSQHQGVKLRSAADPVLYLKNPAGVTRKMRRNQLDHLRELNQHRHEVSGDPETLARIEQYELAYRMQTAVPDLTDISDEPESVLEMYGPKVKEPGSYARNCLLARRMAERDVRFVQLYHMGWDHHDNLPSKMKATCADTDQPTAALIRDLEQRGLLEDTLVVWGGEFGRTVYSQGQLTAENYGRDHHPRCFSMWLAGGGIKGGITYGETDDFAYNIVKDPVDVHDLHATLLHQLGIDHERLTYPSQGRDFRLTDVGGKILTPILA